MSLSKPLLVGGIGGALPVIIDLINTDAASLFEGFNPLVFAGYSVRVALLVLLGALWVWVNRETDIRKALQIGIMAPAIIVSYMNGVEVNSSKKMLNIANQELQFQQTQNASPDQGQSIPSSAGSTFWILPAAFVAEAAEEVATKGVHHKVSSVSKLLFGLTGSAKNGWFVIAGSHKTEVAAQYQVQQLARQGYTAKVFEPFGDSEFYGVMIGSWLTLSEARQLRKQALADGLPSDTYIWNYAP
ncbi:SPOR domain-containing protein [Parasalinivibrio latis]|uniref:SPOR domain-containing protein n=1 Tax=Parasalinivibrio latis TaxID=2952610 RepID=UPI0030E380F8